jgi:hypothetical protein
MLISVDLPAPFSPSRQCTSPRLTEREMRSLARTPGKAFETPISSTAGACPLTLGETMLSVIRDGRGGRSDRPAPILERGC